MLIRRTVTLSLDIDETYTEQDFRDAIEASLDVAAGERIVGQITIITTSAAIRTSWHEPTGVHYIYVNDVIEGAAIPFANGFKIVTKAWLPLGIAGSNTMDTEDIITFARNWLSTQ